MVLASIPKTPQQPHVKKRHGQHHRASKHYTKTYWPYLPMALIIGLGLWANSLWTPKQQVLGVSTHITTTSLLQYTNIERGDNHVGALSLNNALSDAAQQKANDMAKRNYWSHATPEGEQPWQFIKANDYTYKLAGENLAYGFNDSGDVVSGWMHSSGHRDNLLKTDYREVGFGIAAAADYQGGKNQTIVVAMYAAPSSTENSAAAGSAHNSSTDTGQSSLIAKPVSRFEILTSDMGYRALIATTIFAAVLAIVFVYRHGKMWRKYLVKGEQYLMKHPLYDITLLAAVVVSILLSRTSGFIH